MKVPAQVKKDDFRIAITTASCVFICCLLSVLPAISQNPTSYYFQKLDISDGLSQNTVNAVLQDGNGFIWFATKDGLNRYDGLSLKVFKGSRDSSHGLHHSFITTLYEDAEGKIWVGTDEGLYTYDPYCECFDIFSKEARNGQVIGGTVNKIGWDPAGYVYIAVYGQGLFAYHLEKKTFFNFPFSDKGYVRDFQVDGQGRVWVSFREGLYYTDDHFETLKPYTWRNGDQPLQDELITSLYLKQPDQWYIGTQNNGMLILNPEEEKIDRVNLSEDPEESIFVRCMEAYADNELWIGTETGIYIYDVDSERSTHLQNLKSDPFSLSDDAIYSLKKDREGGMWIGSYFGGVNYFPQQTTLFEKYYPADIPGSLQGQRVREIIKGHDGQLWIGTEDAGLFRFNTQTRQFRHITASTQFSNIHGLCSDGQDIWVGTFSHGIKVIDSETGRITSYTASDDPATVGHDFVFSICRTSGNELLIGTSVGLVKYDTSTEQFEAIPELDNNLVYDILEDSGGDIWVATYTAGAYRYEAGKGRWEHFQYSDTPGSIPYNKVLSLFEDSKGRVWLTTEGRGLCRFEPATRKFIRYPVTGDFFSGVIYQIIEDDEGYFWLTTNKGLVHFHPDYGNTKVYTVASGLLSNQFNYKSGYKTEDGTIYIGGIKGLISFNPDDFRENTYIPPVYITDFLLFNQPVQAGADDSPLKKSILFTDSISLDHDQNQFSLRLAALSYQAPELNKLQYRLEGVDEDWQQVSESPLISYSNLNSGKYLFRLRGSNNDQLWNQRERQLFIEIHPPLYLTTGAYVFYALAAIGLVLVFIKHFQQRHRLRQQWFIQHLEQNKERELHEAKMRFFTNITHEIRTPLTLIKGPLEHMLLQEKENDKDTLGELHIMKQNTDRLLELTDQLLDFKKTGHEDFLLNLSEYNIPLLLRDIHRSFLPAIKASGHRFTLTVDTDDFYGHVDRDAFMKIVSNLFSNALKYAEKNIDVRLITGAGDDYFEIQVENDGPLISREQSEDVFKLFTRGNHPRHRDIPGTGIGMYLAHTLTGLHNGTLEILTEANTNCFSLKLPVIHQEGTILSTRQEETGNAIYDPDPYAPVPDNTYTVLVVEDHPDMRTFIKKIIGKKYTVRTAANGEEALDILKKSVVSLIVSDVMMPRMTGIELCRHIRGDINYSHTPIVLLTAKANTGSKIEGMDVGADAYVEKPFSPEYLMAVVANLITNREKLQEAFLRHPTVLSSTTISTEADKKFLNNLREAVHKHIDNSDLKMEDLAGAVHMSRASFYRKIKSTLNLTPNEYLRIERLKMAARLIREGNYAIGDICHTVGFSSPSYFSKCFQEQFGISPKDYR